jgi:hypothetical protein
MTITDALRTEHAIYLRVFDEIEQALPSLTTPSEVTTMARIIEGLLQNHPGGKRAWLTWPWTMCWPTTANWIACIRNTRKLMSA